MLLVTDATEEAALDPPTHAEYREFFENIPWKALQNKRITAVETCITCGENDVDLIVLALILAVNMAAAGSDGIYSSTRLLV